MQKSFRQIFLSFVSLFGIVLLINSLSSCKKDKFLTEGGDISFSVDTLKFDTLFTTIGSVTRSFKLYNNNNKRIKISEIKLEKGGASPFRMNIDGVPTKSIQDVELAPNDSIYIFVAMTVDATTGTLPFLVTDKVLVVLNGNTREVPLEAFGQDAHYIYDSVLTTQTWVNDKPYVIINSALVKTNNILTIQKGCRIYMHQNSKLFVNGTLKVFGTKTDSVIFQGDRLDRDYFGYRDYPGEWGGIAFLDSSNSSNLNYCIIKNAGNPTFEGLAPAAINVSPPILGITTPTLVMNYCSVANSSSFGIIGYNTNFELNNCLINTCGLQNVAMVEGGDYKLNHCTLANYGGIGINHTKDPILAVLNYRDISLTEFVTANLNASFVNCIMFGSLEDEVFFNKKGTATYNVKVENCLYKSSTGIESGLVNELNNLKNQDPQFKEASKWNFRLKSTSPAKGAGIAQSAFTTDLDGNAYLNPPSIGCYEAQ